MKVTFDYRMFIISVLSMMNPELVLEEGSDKDTIVFYPTEKLKRKAKIIGIGFSSLIIPINVEFDTEYKMLTWEVGDGDFRTFTLKFDPNK